MNEFLCNEFAHFCLQVLYYPWPDIQQQSVTQGSPVASGASYQATVTQTYDHIPRLIICYAQQQLTDRTHNTSDTMFGTSSLVLTFGESQQNFATYTPTNLWTMSSRNGYKGSLHDWLTLSGGPVYIR